MEERAFYERLTSNWWGAREEGCINRIIWCLMQRGRRLGIFPKKGGKGIWDDIALGLEAAGLNIKIFVDDVKKVVNHETDDKGKGKEKIKDKGLCHFS